MAYQACLTDAPGSHQRHVAAIDQRINQLFRLLLPIAEVFRTKVAIFGEGIL